MLLTNMFTMLLPIWIVNEGLEHPLKHGNSRHLMELLEKIIWS